MAHDGGLRLNMLSEAFHVVSLADIWFIVG